MRRRIFLSAFLLSCAAVLLVVAGAAVALNGASLRRTEALNQSEAQTLAEALAAGEEIAPAIQLARSGGVRVTVIDEGGAVLIDSLAEAGTMENHLSREEFQEALQTGLGLARRDSATLGEQYLYCAVRLPGGGAVRVARSQRTVLGLLNDMRGAWLAAVLGALALSALLSGYLARGLVRPLLALDLERPEENDVYEELTPLLRRLAEQKTRLDQQMREMETRQNRLSEITREMREGLIVLDERGNVLSINQSARRLLNLGEGDCAGKHLFALCRDARLRPLMETARAGREAEAVLEDEARAVEMRLAPVGGERQGYVLLIVDVTDKRLAERMRREFSSNVTHELKTPLTSISGYAEIMQNGLARPEDMRAFAGKIYQESQRLIALIGDILRLSKLDEGDVRLPREDVDLQALAEQVVATLGEAAGRRGVAVTVTGAGDTVRTVRQIAWELIYNLVDNAIRYNKEGGSVEVRLAGREAAVADTGVGIAPEQREKVFERFYRVDKSHAKDAGGGGTGLGLSIVKHGAAYLGARVALISEVGRGTTVTVTFPEGM